jgi:hypothetical protein
MKKFLLALLVAAAAPAAFGQINIDPPTRSFTKDGGGNSILTSGSGTWTATSNVSWITITPRTSGNAGESCIYVVGSNFSADTRQGVITIGGKTHTVTQTGYNATLSPSSATVGLNGATGTVSITVDAGVAWSAVSNASWVTVTPGSGTSSGSLSYTVAPYGGVTARTTSLTIAGKTFSVTQTGTDVVISPKSSEKAYSSDIVQVAVTALSTTTWKVTPNASWISVVDDGNGFGDSTITLAVGTNPSFLERTGTVSIGSASFTITQAGTPNPILDIIPKEATADPVGAYGNIAVLATPDAPWSAQSLSPWIVISQGASGAGNGNIQYVASANPNLTNRSGQIKITPAVYRPKVDLTWQLESHVYNGSTDASGWGRNLSGSVTQTFNGTNPLALQGQDFYRADDPFTVAFWFTLTEINAVNRLFEADRASGSWSTLYVDASNRLVFKSGAETLTSSFTVAANKTYQVVLSVGTDNKAILYAGERGASIAEVGSRNFTQAPFPANYVQPARVRLGAGNQPSAGNLSNGSIDDLRIHSRALTAVEAAAVFSLSGSTKPYGDTSDKGDSTSRSEYNLRGQALKTGGLQSLGGIQTQSIQFYSSGSVNGSFTSVEISLASVPINGGLVSHVSGAGSGSGRVAYYEYWASMFWRFRFEYTDGSTATTPQRSQIAGGTRSLDEINPFPNKAVKSISVLGYRTHGWDAPSYNAGPMSQLAYNSTASLTAAVTMLSGSKLIAWVPTADRFGVPARALSGTTNSTLYFANHNTIFSTAEATYSMWVRVDQFPTVGSHQILRRSRNGFSSPVFSVGAATNGDLQFSLDGSQATVPAGLVSGQWHLLTLTTMGGGGVKVFIDGEEVGNLPQFSSYALGSASSAEHLVIGGWNGALGYIGFYDGALSSSQIKAIHDSQKPKFAYHTVTQGVVDASISPQTATLPAAGGTTSTSLTIAQNVNWTATTSTPWLSITSPENGAGSTTVQVLTAANPTVYERSGTVIVGGQTFTVTQAGLNADVSYEETVFSTDGGSGWVDVSPEGNAQWQAVSNASWLTVAIGASGTGPGSVFIVADPYTNTSQSRTGSVTIAGKTVYLTQRGYTLSISPEVAQVGSNAGAGEFGVAAPISAVWEAIVTQPWITLVGGNTGLGNGTVRYSLAANTTGQTRTGRIIVSGREYTITQLASLLVTAQAGSGGTVSGGGAFDVNATATLTATPSEGYAFSHWTGDGVGIANPLLLSVDSNKTVQANFVPTTATTSFFNNGVQTGVQSVVTNPNSFGLYDAAQMRSMAVGKPVLEINPTNGKGKIQLGIKQSQNLTNWSDLNINSADVFIRNGKLEVEFTRSGSAAFYRVLGSEAGQ